MMKLYHSLNNTEKYYSKNKSVIDLFEEQVKNNPHHPAIISENGTLSYEELNSKANAIAYKLKNMGIGPDDIIPIGINRSQEMILAVFGILKAGAAYLPLDLNYPSQRIKYIIENAKAKCILSKKEEGKLDTISTSVIYLDQPSLYKDHHSNPVRDHQPHNLAYVCYTSGSTGFPKGVQIEHHSLVNRLEWMQATFPLHPSDRILQKTAFTFDVSIWEIFWWSIVGASVVLLPPRREHDPKTILKTILEFEVSIIHFVPSILQIFLDYLSIKKAPPSIRWVFASGEALSPSLVHLFYQIFNPPSPAKFVNLYGPTEATIDVTYHVCSPHKIYHDVPIGRPIQNTRVYVLTEDNRLAETDQVGELNLAGVCLSRGYLNDKEMTNQKFSSNSSIPESKIYKTGDLVKLDNTGELLYLGRIDEQIKIRGLRIELGEIESHLKNHSLIKDCSLIAVKTDLIQDRFLVAFIVLKNDREANSIELSEFLSHYIPSYMIPSQYRFVSSLPLKSNGKLDKKALEELV